MKNNLEIVYITLVLLTVFAFSLGYFNVINSTFVSILLITTVIKGQLVADYFMGLKSVKFRYRIIPTVWLVSVTSLIAFAYYSPL